MGLASGLRGGSIFVEGSHQLWTRFKIHERPRWGKTLGHPSSCLLKMVPGGDSGEAAKRKDVFLGGVFGFFQESFFGTVLHGPTQCDQSIPVA